MRETRLLLGLLGPTSAWVALAAAKQDLLHRATLATFENGDWHRVLMLLRLWRALPLGLPQQAWEHQAFGMEVLALESSGRWEEALQAVQARLERPALTAPELNTAVNTLVTAGRYREALAAGARHGRRPKSGWAAPKETSWRSTWPRPSTTSASGRPPRPASSPSWPKRADSP